MLVFWLLAAVMLAVALLLVLPPLLSEKMAAKAGAGDHVESNVAIFQERMAALEAEHAAGEMDAESFAEARLELQRELLQDTDGEPAAKRPAGGGVSPVAASLIAALLPLLTFGLYLRLGEPEALDPAATQASHGTSAGASTGSGDPDLAQMEQMVGNLAARLEQQPDDGEGWYMLARSYAVLGRFAAATEAYSRANDLLGEDPGLLVEWAEAIGMANGETLAGRPARMIDRALELAPNSAKGLWLGGFAALQTNRPALAVQRFRLLQTLLPPGSEAGQAITSLLADLGAEPASPASAAQEGETTGAQPGGDAAAAASIAVEVSLAPELAGRVQGDESLFVFARAAEGPRIPLAVVRSSAAALPFNVTLDESQAMQPGMTIASFPQVVIGARLTRGGQPTASSGDLQGFSLPVALDEGPVKVLIDQVVP